MRSVLAELAQHNGFPRVSLYVPVSAGGPESPQIPLRLRRCLRRIEEELGSRGYPDAEMESLLADVRSKAQEIGFFEGYAPGVAVLIGQGETLYLRLPFAPEELVQVGDRYHLRPLLSLIEEDNYYVLAVARGGVRLYRGHRGVLTEVALRAPDGVRAVRDRYDFEDDLGFHTNASRGRGRPGPPTGGGASSIPQYHALGRSPEDYDDVVLDQYLVAIAKGVDQVLVEKNPVLVLAGGPREVGWLRDKFAHGQLADDFVNKNVAALDLAELGRLAWDIARPLVQADQQAALERLDRSLGNPEVPGSRDLAEIAAGALAGRVEVLFVDPAARVWGRFDEIEQRVETTSEPGPGDEDLLDRLAVSAYTTGAWVLPLPEDHRDQVGPAGAVFRW